MPDSLRPLTLGVAAAMLVACLPLAGCSPVSAPEQADAQQAQTPDVPAVAVEDTAAVAGDPNLPMPEGQAAGAESLCVEGERVLFSCAIEGGDKHVSICVSAEGAQATDRFRYAYGVKGQPELVFPDDSAPSAGVFKRTHLMFAGNTGGYAYSFDRAGYTYAVYSISGAEGLEDQGVAVFQGDFNKPRQVLKCDVSTVSTTDDELLVRQTLKWEKDSRIEVGGIPAVDP